MSEKREGATQTEGYAVYAKVKCAKCGKEWTAVAPAEAEVSQLECPECHEQGSTSVVETFELKYTEALNRALGMDAAYFGGDPDVDLLRELCAKADMNQHVVAMSDKELTAIMAAAYTLRLSKEARRGGRFLENLSDIENCRKIHFAEAIEVVYDFIARVLAGK